jgi:hypothetical protein
MARFAPVFVKRHRKTPPLPFRNTKLLQDILHQAPFRQPGLEQVEPDERREKKPVSANIQAKNKACQYKGSCDHPNPSFNVHRFSLPLAGGFPAAPQTIAIVQDPVSKQRCIKSAIPAAKNPAGIFLS